MTEHSIGLCIEDFLYTAQLSQLGSDPIMPPKCVIVGTSTVHLIVLQTKCPAGICY